MRYRAKIDAIVTDSAGKETLIAIGDKVYVAQTEVTKWKVFSFYTRELVTIISQEQLDDMFTPEGTFGRLPREGRFNHGGFKKILSTVIALIPLLGAAQVNPVTWSWKAIRIDSNHFEVHVTADMARGWWIYKPNRLNECLYSPIIAFEQSEIMKPVGPIDVINYSLVHQNERVSNGGVPFCPIPRFSSNVTFSQTFEMSAKYSGLVIGMIRYQAVNKYYVEAVKTVYIKLNVGGFDSMGGIVELDFNRVPRLEMVSSHRAVVTTYPKGIFRKIWHRIKHPFGPSYIKREVK